MWLEFQRLDFPPLLARTMPIQQKGLSIASVTLTTLRSSHQYGILNFSKESNDASTTELTSLHTNDTIVCTTSIPISMSVSEFLEFLAPVESLVSHYRVIGDTTVDTYMVLMKFREAEAASEYYKQYNNRKFSSMEPERCQVIYIESVEINSVILPPYTFPFIHDDLISEETLPTCPVCLEPMDEHVTGLLTIICQHTFHSHCLSKWSDGSCPVCRYSQKSVTGPDMVMSAERMVEETNECSDCHSNTNLWVCLLCGHIGCGRYGNAHAYEHYKESQHIYAIEIESQRVWDYAGDGYVHRLIENELDGKLVELSNRENESTNVNQEKLEAMSIEYSYLLSSQLDSQQIYYENEMEKVKSQVHTLNHHLKSLFSEKDSVLNRCDLIQQQIEETEAAVNEAMDEKKKTEGRLEEWTQRTEGMKQLWLEEKKTTNGLMSSNDILVKSIKEKQDKIQELSDQVRDLTFFLEAREKVQDHPELEGGSVGTRTPHARHNKRKGKR